MNLHSKVMGQGEPMIIMHGVFGMGDNWQTLGRKWAENFEVHLLDMRNHGKSDHSNEFSYDIMCDDLTDYLDQNNINKAIILGHSMGGKVAMLFSVLHPKRVSKLIVGDIGPMAYKPHHQEIIHALQSLKLDNIKSRGEAEKQFSTYIDDLDTRQFLLKSLYWKEKGLLAWRFNLEVIAREILKVGEALPSTAIFSGPTAFIRGGNSWYIKDEDEDFILDHFPDAQLLTIDGAGHWLHAEKPLEFFELVSRFI